MHNRPHPQPRTRCASHRSAAAIALTIAGFTAFTACSAPQKKRVDWSLRAGTNIKLPVNSKIRTGTLSNGLTYFVLPHKKPEKRALLWLGVNAGSALEDDDQQGLAHFVEHMAFNGTKKLKKQAIVDFIERIGMQFGADLNAHTTFDETVYKLQLPTDSDTLDKGFEILREWASSVAFEPEEIEKERGVVLEEWRRSLGAGQRVMTEQVPVLFANSRYAKRLPIGVPPIIKSAPRAAFTRFYRDWYRPNLMAVVVVGDIDADDMEERIKATFGGLLNPAKPRPRPVFRVPPHKEAAVVRSTDKELRATTVQITFKRERNPTGTAKEYEHMMRERLCVMMLNERLREIAQRPDAPFLRAAAGTNRWVRSVDAFSLYASVKSDAVAPGVQAVAREVERARRHGFRQLEMDRAKRALLKAVRLAYLSNSKRKSRSFAREILRHFFAAEPMPGLRVELQLTEAMVNDVTLDDVKRVARNWGASDSRVITASGPDEATMPDKAALLSLATVPPSLALKPWAKDDSPLKLMTKLPKPGLVVRERRMKELGLIVWTLSNGAEVWLRPTTFQNNQVLFRALSKGGHSLAKDTDFESARAAATAAKLGGVGTLSIVQLGHVLAGKAVSVRPYVIETEEGVVASAPVSNVETMLQLTHLHFVAPRKDVGAFSAWRNRQLEALKNRDRAPNSVFMDRLSAYVSQDHPRRLPPTVETLNKVDLDTALAFYRERFADAGDFKFLFVGNLDLAKLRPLVERYIGSLYSRTTRDSTGKLHKPKQPESWRDVGVKRRKKGELTVRKGMEPKAAVVLYVPHTLDAKKPWSMDASEDAQLLAQALRIRLREVLREELGGVYGVRVSSRVSKWPTARATTYFMFNCAPENIDKLKRAALDVVEKVRSVGVSKDIVAKLRASRQRQLETAMKSNGYWLRQLSAHLRFGTDPKRILQTRKRVERVTNANIKATANWLLPRSNLVFARLLPEDKVIVTPAAK